MLRRHSHELGKCARAIPADLAAEDCPPVAHARVLHFAARLNHRSHAIPPEDVGELGFGRVLAFREVTVGRVQGGIMHPQNHLVRLRNRIGHLGQVETADTLQLVNEPRFHALQ